MRIDLALCLPRDVASVAVARHVVVAALETVGADQGSALDIALALSEACANVVEHATVGDHYEVRVTIEQEACTLAVTDEGVGFTPPTRLTAMPAPQSPQGRGIALMEALVDHVDFETEANGGTTVRLVRRIRLEPASAAIDPAGWCVTR